MEAKDWYNEGNDCYDKGDYQQAIDCYNKAIDLKPDYAKVYNSKGTASHNLGEYQQAIDCYDKAIKLTPDDAIAYYNKGNTLRELGKHQQAIDCYDKAIELKPDYANAYNNKGIALGNLVEYKQAIDCYDKAIKLTPDDADVYNNKGNALDDLCEYKQAIDCYDKAIELDPDYADAYYNKGNSLCELGEYKQAIDCYNKAIELTPDSADAYINKGVALDELGEYKQAIDCYNKAIEFKPEDADVYNNKGTELHNLGEYQQAINCYEKAIELKPDHEIAHNNRRILLQMLEEKKRNKDFPEELKDTYLSLYDHDFFNKATNSFSDEILKHCETIYFLSLKILNILQIKEEDKHETGVAHYTTKKVSQILLFDKNKDKPIPFQLSSVTNSNDIQEGKTLFNYLFDNQKMCPQSEKFVAFVGCFMFNFDNLNQFRLYGKDKDTKEEGTGISIVMKSDFFSLVGKSPIQQEGRQISQDDPKAPLFRCIYIDPETSQVVSIGHRDFHTFYKKNDILYNRKNKEDLAKEITKEITKYKEEIDKKIENVRGYLEDLKEEINKAKDQGLEESVICDLLLNLRYLVKHVAFKEEQECRIVMIKRPCDSENEQPIDEDVKHQRFYVNYLPLGNYVKKIFFGPKAAGMELFQSLLTYQKGFEDVICYRSTSPLA